MTRALVEHGLAVAAVCPYCAIPVYLGTCEQTEHDITVYLDGDPVPVESIGRWWMCAHGPTGRAHRWETRGVIEFRPVRALHLEVARRDPVSGGRCDRIT